MYYLDNGATTKVDDEACEKAIYIMKECFGNPSSIHSMGFSAEKELRAARETLLSSLKSKDGEIIFTSGGTEANNLAIFGTVMQNARFGKKIVSCETEHSSVRNCMKLLQKKGFEVVFLKPNQDGEIEESQIIDAITEDTILVSLMSVNNETGYKMPIECVKQAIKNANSKAYFHCDNVQGFLKEDFYPEKLGIDLMSVSGHKVHAPKGVGALYIAKGVKIKPMLVGGGHENNVRAGTQNLPSICAFSKAVENYKKNPNIKELKQMLMDGLAKYEFVQINSPKMSSDYVLNISTGKIKGETMLHFLSQKQIFVSTGSACTGVNASHVLTSMNFDKPRIESSLRISFSKDSNSDDVNAFLSALEEGFQKIAYK